MLHKLGDGVPSISDTLLEHGSDESDCLRFIESEAPRESFLGEGAGLDHGEARAYIARDGMEKRTWWRRSLSCSRGALLMVWD